MDIILEWEYEDQDRKIISRRSWDKEGNKIECK